MQGIRCYFISRKASILTARNLGESGFLLDFQVFYEPKRSRALKLDARLFRFSGITPHKKGFWLFYRPQEVTSFDPQHRNIFPILLFNSYRESIWYHANGKFLQSPTEDYQELLQKPWQHCVAASPGVGHRTVPFRGEKTWKSLGLDRFQSRKNVRSTRSNFTPASPKQARASRTIGSNFGLTNGPR